MELRREIQKILDKNFTQGYKSTALKELLELYEEEIKSRGGGMKDKKDKVWYKKEME